MPMIMTGIRRFTGGALAAALILMGTPTVAYGSEYGDAYKAYNEALARGDTATATTHAMTAWKAAEDALGDNATTAVLAYNYGQLALFDDPESSLPALQRAKTLSDAGIADLPVGDLDVYLTFADFKIGGEKKKGANALRASLQTRDASETSAPTYELGRIWLTLALYDMRKKKYDDAQASASRAEDLFTAAVPGNYQLQAQAILIIGAAKLSKPNQTVDNLTAAHAEFNRALRLFPPQKDIDSFDPIMAKMMAWDYLAHAALASKETLAPSAAAEIDRAWPTYGPVFDNQAAEGECAGEWESRRQPVYPGGARHKDYLGAAIIGYNLAEDGSVRDERVLAEVPDALFGEYAVSAVGTWRRKLPLNPNPACTANLVTSFIFCLRRHPKPSEATDPRLDWICSSIFRR